MPSPAENTRPAWATALSAFCALTVVFLVVRDLTIAEVRDVEVWFGFEVHGWMAWVTAPLHWALFAAGAWGYAQQRPWVWPWASVYAMYIAISHLGWNLVSPLGGGWTAGLTQMILFSIPAIGLLYARPSRIGSPRERWSESRTRYDSSGTRS